MAAPVFTLEQIAQQLQRQWGAENEGKTLTWNDGTLDYAMPDAAPNNNQGAEADLFIPMTARQKAFAREAFELWDDLIQTHLTDTNSQDAQITFAYSSSTIDDGTYTSTFLVAQPPDSSTFDREIDHQRIWMDANMASWPQLQDANMAYGERGFRSYIHEIGHALGLSHPGSYNDGDGASYANAEYTQDTGQWTVMSYWLPGADGTVIDRTGSDATTDITNDGIDISTPLLHDILAIQAKYGADMSTRTGNTVYGFNSNADRGAFNFNLNPNPVIAIWDAGGNDTLDCSGFSQNQRIDLNAGAFSDVGALTMNVAIAYDVSIENANGGSGNDSLTGSGDNNILNGFGGDDTLIGAGGADVLYGADGNDTLAGGFGYVDALYGGAGDDTYLVDDLDIIVESFGAGYDTVRSSVRWVLGDNLETLILTGAASVNAFGNSLDNLLFGNAGNNYLQGAGGADTLAGGDGNDYYELGDLWLMNEQSGYRYDVILESPNGGTDTVSVGYFGNNSYSLDANVENVVVSGRAGFTVIGNELGNSFTGNAAHNLFYGQDGDDVFNGGAGYDELIGGDGNDVYRLDDLTLIDEQSGYAYDAVGEAVNGGSDTVYVSYRGNARYFVDAQVENVVVTGLGGLDVIGNELGNNFVGNAAHNLFYGQGGNDTLNGGLGFDELIGGEGDDFYFLDDISFIDEQTGSRYDAIGEAVNAGTDTVFVSYLGNARFFLDAEVENVLVTGAGNLDVIANDLANSLIGNAAHNLIYGEGGDDTLSGGAGFDTLFGGAGADHFADSPAGLHQDQIADLGLDDMIDLTGVRFGALRYDPGTGVLALDSNDDGGFATLVNLATGLVGEFVAIASAADQPASTQVQLMLDTDGDGVGDFRDNAIGMPNADQRDSDGDGYGNVADADFNQDLMVDFLDLSILESRLFTDDPDADLDGDGQVDLYDLSLLGDLFGQPPGPSYADNAASIDPLAAAGLELLLVGVLAGANSAMPGAALGDMAF